MDITRFYRAELADKDRSLSISLVKGRFCDRINLSRGEKNIYLKILSWNCLLSVVSLMWIVCLLFARIEMLMGNF